MSQWKRIAKFEIPANNFHYLIFSHMIFMFMALVDNQPEIDYTVGPWLSEPLNSMIDCPIRVFSIQVQGPSE